MEAELRSGRRGSVMLGAAVAAAMAAIVSLALGFSVAMFHNDSYLVSAHYPTANGLINGSDVYIGGVKVGVVQNLVVDNDGKGVVVTAAVDPKYGPVHRDATMYIRPKSLLGEKYLALTIGSPSEPTLTSPATLPESATQVNVEIDQLINTFDEPTRKELQLLIKELGTGVAGQGRMTNETLQSGAQNLTALANVTDVLQSRDAELKRIIDALTRLTQTISSDQQRTTYVNLLQHSDAVLKTLRDEDAQVALGIDRMNTFFASVDQGLAGRQSDLQAIFADLPNTLSALDSLSVNLTQKAQTALPVVKSTLPAALAGDLIFGSQPVDKNAFTSDIFTRVMTTQGCFTVSGRTTDPTTGQAKDSGTPAPGSICTAGGGIGVPGVCANPVSPAEIQACVAALKAQVCAAAPNNPVCQIVGLAAQPGAAVAGGPSGGSGRASISGTSAVTPVDPATEQQLLRYLLQ